MSPSYHVRFSFSLGTFAANRRRCADFCAAALSDCSEKAGLSASCKVLNWRQQVAGGLGFRTKTGGVRVPPALLIYQAIFPKRRRNDPRWLKGLRADSQMS